LTDQGIFSGDATAQAHARAWAENRWRDHGDSFVLWLLTLDTADQKRIFDLGYHVTEREFEEWLEDN